MICNLCKKKIDTKKEGYTHIENWYKEKFLSDIWCHKSCFNKAMNRDLTELEKDAQEMLKISSNIFEKLGIKREQEYVIK